MHATRQALIPHAAAAWIAVLATIACSNGRSAEPARRETWEVMRSGDVDFGSMHTVFEPLPEGGQRIERQLRYLVDLFGQRQEIKETREWIVGSTGAPVSCRMTSQSQAGSTAAEGKVAGQELRVSIVRGTSKLERTIALDEGAIFDVCLPSFLARQPADTRQARVPIIDTDAWRLQILEVKRIAAPSGQTKWKVGEGVWTFDAEGERQQSDMPLMARTVRRATPDEAAAIDYLKYAPRELLTFPVKQSIPFPERAKKIVVRISWKDFPLESMHLEDSRQRIVRQEERDGRHEVDLELTPAATIENAPAIPVVDPAFAEYLADNDYIRPSDPTIQAQAKTWTASSTTTLEAARALSRTVADYLQGGEMIAETLSGPEVLACRKGKCSEYTTLLASLARSVGVPTRVALGMRLTGGQWMGHMWCEVWVGRWIPVDATADEVGGSPALLKLTHSASVDGTQNVRWAMTRSLEVEVLEFEAGQRAELGLTTGIVRRTYTNADFACRITAPEGWSWHDKSTPGVPTLQCQGPDADGGDRPLVHFVAFALPTRLDASILVKARQARFAASYKKFQVLIDEPQAVGASAGRKFCFQQQDPKNPERTLKTTEIIWTNDRTGYLVNLIAETEKHDATLGAFDALWKSFERMGP